VGSSTAVWFRQETNRFQYDVDFLGNRAVDNLSMGVVITPRCLAGITVDSENGACAHTAQCGDDEQGGAFHWWLYHPFPV